MRWRLMLSWAFGGGAWVLLFSAWVNQWPINDLSMLLICGTVAMILMCMAFAQADGAETYRKKEQPVRATAENESEGGGGVDDNSKGFHWPFGARVRTKGVKSRAAPKVVHHGWQN
jgi:hypothetical protein